MENEEVLLSYDEDYVSLYVEDWFVLEDSIIIEWYWKRMRFCR